MTYDAKLAGSNVRVGRDGAKLLLTSTPVKLQASMTAKSGSTCNTSRTCKTPDTNRLTTSEVVACTVQELVKLV
jgi:hypothetical protein